MVIVLLQQSNDAICQSVLWVLWISLEGVIANKYLWRYRENDHFNHKYLITGGEPNKRMKKRTSLYFSLLFLTWSLSMAKPIRCSKVGLFLWYKIYKKMKHFNFKISLISLSSKVKSLDNVFRSDAI